MNPWLKYRSIYRKFKGYRDSIGAKSAEFRTWAPWFVQLVQGPGAKP